MNGAEDCLTLDVYTPQVTFENLLPVVVVVGSSHITGGSTTPLLQPTAKLSRAKEVVFVRPNFRLGVSHLNLFSAFCGFFNDCSFKDRANVNVNVLFLKRFLASYQLVLCLSLPIPHQVEIMDSLISS